MGTRTLYLTVRPLSARAVAPLLIGAGHQVAAPTHSELDLFDRDRVEPALAGVQVVFHLATRIPPREAQGNPEVWRENDRLRREATQVLVDSALAAGVQRLTFPSVAGVDSSTWPDGGVVSDGERVSNARFRRLTGWRPEESHRE